MTPAQRDSLVDAIVALVEGMRAVEDWIVVSRIKCDTSADHTAGLHTALDRLRFTLPHLLCAHLPARYHESVHEWWADSIMCSLAVVQHHEVKMVARRHLDHVLNLRNAVDELGELA